jgi:hypothetical protein
LGQAWDGLLPGDQLATVCRGDRSSHEIETVFRSPLIWLALAPAPIVWLITSPCGDASDRSSRNCGRSLNLLRQMVSSCPSAGCRPRPSRLQRARRQPPRSPPKARVTAATPRSAPLPCSARRRPRIPIGGRAMAFPNAPGIGGKRARSRYFCASTAFFSRPEKPSASLRIANATTRSRILDLGPRSANRRVLSADVPGEAMAGCARHMLRDLPRRRQRLGKRGAASRPSIRSNQGRKFGDRVGRK